MFRTWKTFHISSSTDARALQSALHNFPTPNHIAKLDKFAGGGILESDLSLRELRALFRMSGVRWIDYVTDTKASWEAQPAAECAGLEGCQVLEGAVSEMFVHDKRCPKGPQEKGE